MQILLTAFALAIAMLAGSAVSSAQEMRIAAAGSLRQVLPEIVEAFMTRHPDAAVSVRYGASGSLAYQIIHGSPDHLFLSADQGFAQRVADAGLSLEPVRNYAIGTLVLFRPVTSAYVGEPGLNALDPGTIARLAIAHPDNAPYGRAAKAALITAGLWDRLGTRLVIGENVAQAAQFAAAGHVDLALIAKSQALFLEDRGDWTEVELPPGVNLEHDMVLLEEAARPFFDFMQSADAALILRDHGFETGN